MGLVSEVNPCGLRTEADSGELDGSGMTALTASKLQSGHSQSVTWSWSKVPRRRPKTPVKDCCVFRDLEHVSVIWMGR